MAFHQLFYSFFFFNLLTTIYSAHYLLPIIKDDATPQYYTSLSIGTPPVSVHLSIDLANRFSWFTCNIVGYNRSSTYRNIDCDSPQCATYGGNGCLSCQTIPPTPPTPSCNNNSCGAATYTPWSSYLLYTTGLISDTLHLPTAALKHFPFICSDYGPLKGLSPHTKGVVSLARLPISLHAQISSTLKVPRKFALCLPSSAAANGAMLFGGGPYKPDVSKSLVTTTLLVNPNKAPFYTVGDPSVEYFIGVKSIKIDGTIIKLNNSLLSFDKDGNGGTKFSTLTPYTALHSQIYKPFVELFTTKAAALGVVKVAAVAPFGACFSSRSVKYNARTGRGLPIIDLWMREKSAVLHGKNARWRIYGSNSMVMVSKEVECLGFVDGGSPMTAVVIGGKQMEDNLVELDLEGNKVGFSSSLLTKGLSCSQFRGV